MKAWKTIVVAAFSIIVVAMITASAFAYHTSGQGIYTPYRSYRPATAQERIGNMMWSMIRGFMGSPMRRGYAAYNSSQPGNGFPQSSDPNEYGSMMDSCRINAP
jgi:hypothetical protein